MSQDCVKLHTFVLTVPKQLDRYIGFIKCNEHILKYIDLESFTAIPVTDKAVVKISRKAGKGLPEVSNRLSFAAILRDARSRGYDKVLILEDDVQFEGNVKAAFRTVREQLPEDFALCTFGTYFRKVRPKGLQRYSGGLMSFSGKVSLWGAHAFIFSAKVYDECIANYEAVQGEITDQYIHKTLAKNHPHKCYVCRPMVAFSRPVIGMHSVFDFKGIKKRSIHFMETHYAN